jgi:hypothetical protein
MVVIAVHAGERFRLVLQNLETKFIVTFNDEVLLPFDSRSGVKDITFQSFSVTGKFDPYFYGFLPPGTICYFSAVCPIDSLILLSDVPNAVPLFSKITYKCPEGWQFEHNIFALPFKRVTCEADGDFKDVDFWPVCKDPTPTTGTQLHNTVTDV